MSYIHTDGVEYSDDKKTLIRCPKEATEITILDSVTSIGEWAFSDCSGLTSIVIPDGVTSIGEDAFFACSGPTSISVDVNNPKYDSRNNCNAIIETETNILIAGCKNTIIPDSVTSIGENAFRDCSGLTSIVIPDGVTSIGEWAFSGCSGLTSIVIPDGVTSIGEGAFSSCSGLTSIVIPDGVTSIEGRAFSGCSGLTSIVIPDSVTSIEKWAFSGCSGLTSTVIPDSVTSIEKAAFSGCSGLTSISVDVNNPKYDSRNNCNAIIGTETNTLIAGCKNTIIPDSVTSIGESAFSDCSGLTSIVIPDGVTSIGKYTFYGCPGLKEIRIPKGTRDKFCAMPELKKDENLLVEYKKEEKEKCATPESEEFRILTNLAKAYELGIGVAKNYAQAILFYTQAAEKGSAEAAYKLAEWYAAGEHLPKDYEKAMQFYQQAAKSAFSDAKQKVEQLQKKIDEENERLRDFMQEEWEEREKQQLLNNKETILFFDTETNGLPGNYKLPPSSTYNWPRVLQLGWIITDVDGNVRKEKSVYIYPDGFEVTAEVTKLMGITTSHIRQYGEDIADVLEEFMSDVMSVTKVIGHNVSYDKKVLASELYRLNKDYNSLLNKPSVCTMERTTNWCAIPTNSYYGGYKYPKLQELYAKLFGENFTDAHDALADIRATKECYFELIERGIIK